MKFPMKKKLLIAALVPTFGLPMVTLTHAQSSQSSARQGQQQPQQQNIRDMRASELIGAKVRDKQGQELGDVQDLIVDASDQRVNYAILAFGGVLGFGEKLFAYPMDRFQARSSGDEKELVLSVSEQELKNAPGFDRSNWPTFGDSGYRGEVDKHFGKTAKAGGNLVRVSELLDEEVSDRAGADVGQIEDVVVSVNDGRVRFVALQPSNALQLGDRIVMLPMNAIEATSKQQFESRQSGDSGMQAEGESSRAEQARANNSEQQEQTSGASTQQSTGQPQTKSGSRQQAQQEEQDAELKLVLNVPARQLRNARSFQEGQWPDLNSRSFQRDMDRYVASFPSGSMTSGASAQEPKSSGASSGEGASKPDESSEAEAPSR